MIVRFHIVPYKLNIVHLEKLLVFIPLTVHFELQSPDECKVPYYWLQTRWYTFILTLIGKLIAVTVS